MKDCDKLTVGLLIAGGLNWGLVGLFNFNLITSVFGGLSRFVFIAVGWAAVHQLVNWDKLRGGSA